MILSLDNLLCTAATETGIANKAQGTGLACSISSLHAVLKVLGDTRFLSFLSKLRMIEVHHTQQLFQYLRPNQRLKLNENFNRVL
jgi:hypothetical protein